MRLHDELSRWGRDAALSVCVPAPPASECRAALANYMAPASIPWIRMPPRIVCH